MRTLCVPWASAGKEKAAVCTIWPPQTHTVQRHTASNRRALWRRRGIRWHHARGSLGAQGQYAVLPSSKNNNSILSIHLPIQGFYSLLYDVRTPQLGEADINCCVYLF